MGVGRKGFSAGRLCGEREGSEGAGCHGWGRPWEKGRALWGWDAVASLHNGCMTNAARLWDHWESKAAYPGVLGCWGVGAAIFTNEPRRTSGLTTARPRTHPGRLRGFKQGHLQALPCLQALELLVLGPLPTPCQALWGGSLQVPRTGPQYLEMLCSTWAPPKTSESSRPQTPSSSSCGVSGSVGDSATC